MRESPRQYDPRPSGQTTCPASPWGDHVHGHIATAATRDAASTRICAGQRLRLSVEGRAVKPSAQPTLVRTQHLPHQRKRPWAAEAVRSGGYLLLSGRSLRRSVEVTSDDCQELVNVERLDQEIRSARREELVDGHRVRVAAEDDDRDRGGGWDGSKLEQDLLAVGVGKAVVEQDEGRLVVDRRLDAVPAGHGGMQLDVRAPVLEQALEEEDVVLVVVDVQHDAVHGAGTVRGAGSAPWSCPVAKKASSWPGWVRSSGLVG